MQVEEKWNKEQLDISDSSTILNNVNYLLMMTGSLFSEETNKSYESLYVKCDKGQG